MFRAPELQARIPGATMPTAPASLSEFLASKGFKGAPEKPRYGTRDRIMYTDAFGKKTMGGSTDAQYHKKLAEFFKSNPGAMEAAQERQKSQQFQVSGPVNGLHQGPLKPPQEIIPQKNMSGRGDSGGLPAVALPDYLAGIRAENKTRQDKINSGELVRDPNQRDRGPPRYITKAEADALRPTREEPVFGGQTSGGIGGLQQFMQIMQMIMQMVQQSQGMGMGGMGMGDMGGMRRNNFAQPPRFGGFNQYQSQQQYRPQFQQNFNNPYGPY